MSTTEERIDRIGHDVAVLATDAAIAASSTPADQKEGPVTMNTTIDTVEERVPAEVRAEISRLIRLASDIAPQVETLVLRHADLADRYSALPTTQAPGWPGDMDTELMEACGFFPLDRLTERVADALSAGSTGRRRAEEALRELRTSVEAAEAHRGMAG